MARAAARAPRGPRGPRGPRTRRPWSPPGAGEGASRPGTRPPRPYSTERTVPVSWLSLLLRVLRQPLDVLEHPQVDRPHDPVGIELPVGLRRHLHLVPGASLEPRAPAGEREQPELAPGRSEVPVQVRGVHVAVGAPLAHRRRLGRDVEPEQPVLLPVGDRLDEAARGEIAGTDRAHSRAVEPPPQRGSDPPPE